jgi:hypothetical protein
MQQRQVAERSRAVTEQLESLFECSRMIPGDSREAPVSAWVREGLPTASINFLHAEEPETLNGIIEKTLLFEIALGHDRGVDVQGDLDPAVPSFALYPATVGPALVNLVSEAIVQSPEGGLLRVETRCRADRATLLLIGDDETAIRAEETRFETDPSMVKAATGDSTDDAGLFVVRSITEENGGTISLMAPPDGLGVIVRYGTGADATEIFRARPAQPKLTF